MKMKKWQKVLIWIAGIIIVIVCVTAYLKHYFTVSSGDLSGVAGRIPNIESTIPKYVAGGHQHR